MKVCDVMTKMIDLSEGHHQRIAHFMRVHNYARTIGEAEGLDADTLLTLEFAAVIHDISIPTCMVKYGKASGDLQEAESEPLVRAFFEGTDVEPERVDRIAWMISHHHSYDNVVGIDYQILLEADYLVNAEGQKDHPEAISAFEANVFKTACGKHLLESIYLRG